MQHKCRIFPSIFFLGVHRPSCLRVGFFSLVKLSLLIIEYTPFSDPKSIKGVKMVWSIPARTWPGAHSVQAYFQFFHCLHWNLLLPAIYWVCDTSTWVHLTCSLRWSFAWSGLGQGFLCPKHEGQESGLVGG